MEVGWFALLRSSGNERRGGGAFGRLQLHRVSTKPPTCLGGRSKMIGPWKSDKDMMPVLVAFGGFIKHALQRASCFLGLQLGVMSVSTELQPPHGYRTGSEGRGKLANFWVWATWRRAGAERSSLTSSMVTSNLMSPGGVPGTAEAAEQVCNSNQPLMRGRTAPVPKKCRARQWSLTAAGSRPGLCTDGCNGWGVEDRGATPV